MIDCELDANGASSASAALRLRPDKSVHDPVDQLIYFAVSATLLLVAEMA